MEKTMIAVFFSVLIAALAVPYGIASGKAEGNRLRELKRQVLAGEPIGYITLLLVAAAILWVMLNP